MSESRRVISIVVLVLTVGCLLPALAMAAGIQQPFVFSGSELKVVNMIGHVEILPASGPDFTVSVDVLGDDAQQGILKFKQTEGRDQSLVIQFPVDEHSDYVYPALGGRGRTTITYRNDEPRNENWFRRLIAGVTSKRVTVRGRGKGLEIWADLKIEVPASAHLKVIDRVGEIEARNIDGDLDLDTSRGGISVEDIHGDIMADTGSGSVTVVHVQGNVVADTGSGSVSVAGVYGGRVDVDTGSGAVALKQIKAQKIHADTGSGGVRVEQAECEKLSVDTGSGSVEATGIAADRAVIDTGSGAATLVLASMGKGRFNVDTGSGSIKLVLPDGASAHISAETSSGGVHCEVENAKILHKKGNELEAVIGDGEAQVTLDAGSGSISIESR